MNCKAVAAALEAYLSGELGAAGAERIRAHLVSCAGCRRLHEQRMALRSLARAELQRAAPAELRAAVLAAMEGAEDAETAGGQRRSPAAPGRVDRGLAAVRARRAFAWMRSPLGAVVPAVAAVAMVIFMLVRSFVAHEGSPATARAFSAPAAVTTIRYGEASGGGAQPEAAGLVLGDPPGHGTGGAGRWIDATGGSREGRT